MGVYGAPNHKYIVIGKDPEKKLIIDGAWKQFVLGDDPIIKDGREKAPDIFIAPTPGINSNRFQEGLDTIINGFEFSNDTYASIEVPKFTDKHNSMWGSELVPCESIKIEMTEAQLQNRLSLIWQIKPLTTFTPEQFSKCLSETLQSSGDRALASILSAMEGKLIEFF